jgi:hypothetical protein
LGSSTERNSDTRKNYEHYMTLQQNPHLAPPD